MDVNFNQSLTKLENVQSLGSKENKTNKYNLRTRLMMEFIRWVQV